MSEAYRDRAPDIEGRLDLIERALAQVMRPSSASRGGFRTRAPHENRSLELP